MQIELPIQRCLEIGCALQKLDHDQNITERHEVARLFFEEALRQDPLEPNALSNLGTLHVNLKDHASANGYLGKAILNHPEYAGAWVNLGNLRIREEQFNTAISMYRVAEALGPPFLDEVFVSRSLAEQMCGNRQAAMDYYRRALVLSPGKPEAETFLGMLLLQAGDYTQGAPLYEARLKTAPPWQVSHESLKRWNGQPVDVSGKKMLVMAEQGIGDCVQFCRYFKWLKERGAIVYAFVPDNMGVLMQTFAGEYIDQLYPASGHILPSCDIQIAMASLPYLRLLSGDGYVMPWIERPVASSMLGSEPLIGLCWKGNPKHPNDRYRSMTDTEAEGLYSAIKPPPRRIFSLQHDGELKDLVHPFRQNWETDMKRMNEAAVIISVDTSVAHVAASMGRPVFLLLSKYHDWRWGKADTSEWYPTVKIFRQSKLGVWDDVIDKVTEALGNLP